MVGKFRWYSTYSIATESKLVLRCFDYAENKDGTKCTMFYVDAIASFENGKICHFEALPNAEQGMLLAKIL